MFDFYVSDLGTQMLSESKYYWQNEKAKCCILVPDITRNPSAMTIPIHFLQAAPAVKVVAARAVSHWAIPTRVVATPGVINLETIEVQRVAGRCVRPENCGRILNAVFDLIDADSWSFPRAKATEPYINEATAEILEKEFKKEIEDMPIPCVYASIGRAGTMLANRMGIASDVIYEVSHYDQMTNTQCDEMMFVKPNCDIDLIDKTVIVIDDLISSCRTANAVIERILNEGASRVYFFALYRTVCSQEVPLIEDARVVVRSMIPLSNAYWTYGRGFDLTDEDSRHLPDIYASTKHWDWEKDEDVDDLIRFFSGKFLLKDYIE